MTTNLANMTKEGLLPICSQCKSIKIGYKESEKWISPDEIEERGELYRELMDKYEKKLTHTYCPSCFNKIVEEQGLADYA